jgi:hypothetical protein
MPSSVISSMHYDSGARTLTIVYRGKRGIYRYYDVSPEEFDAFRAAPSKGTYLNQIFKARHPVYERLSSSHGIHLVERPSRPAAQSEQRDSNHRKRR